MLVLKERILSYLWANLPYLFLYVQWLRKGKIFHKNTPRDLNEKILWLMLNTDTSEWTRLADKYKVREYVKERGLENILVKLYAKYDSVQDIDYESLPTKFVLKCNHDFGSCQIVDKEKGFDKEAINKDLYDHMCRKFGSFSGEFHYARIRPCIIAEEYLESKENKFSTSIIDYKVWCFDGKPYCVWVVYSRTPKCMYTNVYDLDWNVHPEYSVYNEHYMDGQGMVPRPKSLSEMLTAASVLSKGFPQVRVDFYDVDGKLYFGEMTFTSASGQMNYFTDDFLKLMGEQCTLPNENVK